MRKVSTAASGSESSYCQQRELASSSEAARPEIRRSPKSSPRGTLLLLALFAAMSPSTAACFRYDERTNSIFPSRSSGGGGKDNNLIKTYYATGVSEGS